MKKAILAAIIATSATLSFGPKPKPSLIPTSPHSPSSPKKVSPKRKSHEALKDSFVDAARNSYKSFTEEIIVQTKEDTKKLEDFMAFIKEKDLLTTVITFASKALVKQRKQEKHNIDKDIPFEEQDFFNEYAAENYIVAKQMILRELEDENSLFSNKQLKNLFLNLLRHLFDALDKGAISPNQLSQEILDFKLGITELEKLLQKKLEF